MPGTAAAELVQGEVVRDPLNGGASRHILHKRHRIKKCCGSASGRIVIIWADPDPFKPKEEAELNLFPENFNILSKILKIMTSMTLTRNITQCKLPTCVKLGAESDSGSGSASTWKVGPDESRSASNRFRVSPQQRTPFILQKFIPNNQSICLPVHN